MTELKDLITGRGGKCKSVTRKAELVTAVEALPPQSVAIEDEVDEVDALEDSLAVMDDHDQQQPRAATAARGCAPHGRSISMRRAFNCRANLSAAEMLNR